MYVYIYIYTHDEHIQWLQLCFNVMILYTSKSSILFRMFLLVTSRLLGTSKLSSSSRLPISYRIYVGKMFTLLLSLPPPLVSRISWSSHTKPNTSHLPQLNSHKSSETIHLISHTSKSAILLRISFFFYPLVISHSYGKSPCYDWVNYSYGHFP